MTADAYWLTKWWWHIPDVSHSDTIDWLTSCLRLKIHNLYSNNGYKRKSVSLNLYVYLRVPVSLKVLHHLSVSLKISVSLKGNNSQRKYKCLLNVSVPHMQSLTILLVPHYKDFLTWSLTVQYTRNTSHRYSRVSFHRLTKPSCHRQSCLLFHCQIKPSFYNSPCSLNFHPDSSNTLYKPPLPR